MSNNIFGDIISFISIYKLKNVIANFIRHLCKIFMSMIKIFFEKLILVGKSASNFVYQFVADSVCHFSKYFKTIKSTTFTRL